MVNHVEILFSLVNPSTLKRYLIAKVRNAKKTKKSQNKINQRIERITQHNFSPSYRGANPLAA